MDRGIEGQRGYGPGNGERGTGNREKTVFWRAGVPTFPPSHVRTSPRPHVPTSARPQARRPGSVYVAVLGTATLVALTGISAILAVRTQQRVAGGEQDLVAARHLALSALELGMLKIADDTNWRSNLTDGYWYTNSALGGGTFSLHAADPLDGDLTRGVCDPLVLTGYGYQGAACQILRVTLEAAAAGTDPLYSAIMSRNPLAYWRLGEGAEATTAVDQKGAYPGTYRNGVALGVAVPHRCDTAAEFDGANDLIEIPHSSAFLLDNGTVQFWFWADSVAYEQGLLMKESLGFDNGGHLAIWINSTQRVMARLQSTWDNYYLESGVITARQWTHVAVTFGTSGFRLYVDGSLVDSDGYSGGLGTSSGGSGNREPLAIGVSTAISGDLSVTPWEWPFRGRIDEVALFGSVLNAGAVQALYTAGSTIPPHTMTVVLGSWQPVVN